jgi:hypothetical protein
MLPISNFQSNPHRQIVELIHWVSDSILDTTYHTHEINNGAAQ